jgi:flavin reductase (DIM6/NTAB) family NADH-FMN oxidoreductase RutF
VHRLQEDSRSHCRGRRSAGAGTLMMMSHRIFQTLQPGLPSVLVTVDDEGFGHAVMTWAVAATSDRVRFVADHRSRTLANLQRTGKAGLEIIGPGIVLAMI